MQDLRERAYQAKLNKMSVPELKDEKAKLQNLLMTARWSDPKARAWVEKQLTMVTKELAQRGTGELSAYQQKLDKMSVPELRTERAEIMRMLTLGRWTPEGYKTMTQKLALVNKELASRGVATPRAAQVG